MWRALVAPSLEAITESRLYKVKNTLSAPSSSAVPSPCYSWGDSQENATSHRGLCLRGRDARSCVTGTPAGAKPCNSWRQSPAPCTVLVVWNTTELSFKCNQALIVFFPELIALCLCWISQASAHMSRWLKILFDLHDSTDDWPCAILQHLSKCCFCKSFSLLLFLCRVLA